ncbi:Acyl-coenzyme A thioesterase PaaI, partial [Geodia barretti]
HRSREPRPAAARSRPAGPRAGIELTEATLGRATARMTVRDGMLNSAGKCHGGVIFTLADTAFQCACNSHGRLTVSSGASIQYVRPASAGDELIAVCVERYRNRSGGGYDVTVTPSERGGRPGRAAFGGPLQRPSTRTTTRGRLRGRAGRPRMVVAGRRRQRGRGPSGP